MIPIELQPLANHLWQSTLVAAVAGLLTLALRKNRAQTRYWLWLAASVKFLIPFSILVDAGGHFARHIPEAVPHSRSQSSLSLAIEQASQPFAESVPLTFTTVPTARPSRVNWIPVTLCAVWAIGFVTLGCSWWLRWRRIRVALRSASPLQLPIDMEAMTSPEFPEPGVFGLWRPVLLLPAGITGNLTPPQFEAILEHELCHVRRRDNLATAIHMIVEAVFWFYPLAWWLGARLMEERERACDEEVLRSGSEPVVYAEGILKICELYLESPLQCVAGVTGANLTKRIEAIMADREVLGLSLAKKVALAVAGMAALAAPIGVGMMNAPHIQAQSVVTSPVRESSPVLVAQAKPPAAALPSEAPKQVVKGPTKDMEDILRARITRFYDLHIAGQYGDAEEFVAAESRDLFRSLSKPKLDSYKIGNIEYSDNFTKAKVVMVGKMPVLEISDGKTLDMPFASFWKVEGGEWCWYYNKEAVRNPSTPVPALSPTPVRPLFEVASVKPSHSSDRRSSARPDVRQGHLTVANFTMKMLIRQAYHVKLFQISGGPAWMDSDLFNIDAKEGPVDGTQFNLMFQSLLADRFQLVIRPYTKEMPMFALVAAKNGPKFKEVHNSDPNMDDPIVQDVFSRPNLLVPATPYRRSIGIVRHGLLIEQGITMPRLADALAGTYLGREVVDETGLTGTYDLRVEWHADESQVAMARANGVQDGYGAPPPDWQGPSLFTALEEQLGLKLESRKGPVQMFAVERVERPSEN